MLHHLHYMHGTALNNKRTSTIESIQKILIDNNIIQETYDLQSIMTSVEEMETMSGVTIQDGQLCFNRLCEAAYTYYNSKLEIRTGHLQEPYMLERFYTLIKQLIEKIGQHLYM